MRVLLISDLHGQRKCLEYLRIIIAKQKVKALICCGDITSYQDKGYLDELFSIFIENRMKAFIVWGNSDSAEIQEKILNSPYSIHLEEKKLENWRIYGISFTDDLGAIDSQKIKGSILVTHRPPLKRTMEKVYANAPAFHLSGHMHYQSGLIAYPSTIHIKVPSLTLGRYGIFEPDSKRVQFLAVKV